MTASVGNGLEIAFDRAEEREITKDSDRHFTTDTGFFVLRCTLMYILGVG